MNRKIIKLGALAGPLSGVFLLVSIVLFGYLESGYSHELDSVSGLGALSSSNTCLFNLFGLFLPGAMVAVSFLAQYRMASEQNVKNVCVLMMSFGIMFSALAFPMDLSPLPLFGVTVHYIFAYLSVLPFLLASAIFAWLQRGSRKKVVLATILPAVFVCAHLMRYVGVSDGFVQRGLLVCIFGWVAVVSYRAQSRF